MLQRAREAALLVEDVRDPAAHPGGEVAPGRPEHDDAAAGHVLAAVVADALDDGAGRPSCARRSARRRARGRTPGRPSRRRGRCCRRSRSPRPRRRRPPAAGRRARRRTGPCRCSRSRRRRASASMPGASQAPNLWPAEPWSVTRIVSSRQPRRRRARFATSLREQPADGAVDVADGDLGRRPARRCSIAARAASISSQSSASGERRVLRRARAGSGVPAGTSGMREHVREVDAARLPVLDRVVGLEQVDAADQVVERARRRAGAMIWRASSATKKKKLTTCSGWPWKRLRSSGSCVAMPDRARVQVAGAHHDAARRDQRRGREAHLVGAEQRGDRRRRGRSSAGRRSAPRSASAGR